MGSTRVGKTSGLPDTGAMMCVCGLGSLHKLGLRDSDLVKPALRISAANSEQMQLLGAIFLKISGVKKATKEKRSIKRIVYVAKMFQNSFFRSQHARI